MRLRPYSTYKDTGVKSLGSVPAHWDVAPIKYHVLLRSGGTPSKEVPSYWDGDVPWASSKDLKTESLADTQDHISLHALEAGAAELTPAGSILIVVRGMILAHTFPVAKIVKPMAINQDLKAILPRERLTADYLAWLLRGLARESLGRADEAAHGTKVLRLADWTSMEVPLPTWDEQSAIVAFLDRETAKIDALIAEQQRLMELLQEKRQAVISHAVTKGLNPDAPMKPSGVEWLGEVPAHWEVRRTKSVSSFATSGPRGWAEQVGESGALFIQSGDLNGALGIAFDTAKRVAVISSAEAERTRLAEGDVLVCITGAKTGNVGVCSSLPEPAYVNQHLCLIRPSDDIRADYLGLVLHGAVGQTQFALAQYGLKQGLSLEDVREAVVPLPPIHEQTAICSHIERWTTQCELLVTDASRAIDLLTERRGALISAAVTGQINVCEPVVETTT